MLLLPCFHPRPHGRDPRYAQQRRCQNLSSSPTWARPDPHIRRWLLSPFILAHMGETIGPTSKYSNLPFHPRPHGRDHHAVSDEGYPFAFILAHVGETQRPLPGNLSDTFHPRPCGRDPASPRIQASSHFHPRPFGRDKIAPPMAHGCDPFILAHMGETPFVTN